MFHKSRTNTVVIFVASIHINISSKMTELSIHDITFFLFNELSMSTS